MIMMFLFSISDTNECFSNPCSHGATCRNVPGGFFCECTEGWTGPLCKTGKPKAKKKVIRFHYENMPIQIY